MKTLILMRHAKSDWSSGGSDHDRPLNPRGRKAAAALGAWLRDAGLVPDEVLCSSAMRTRETLVRLELAKGAKETVTRDLYLAEPEEMLTTLRGATGDCVLMVAHNPGIGWSAEQLVKDAPTHPQFSQYPTGATLVADFDIGTWSDADWGNANARHFVVPREL